MAQITYFIAFAQCDFKRLIQKFDGIMIWEKKGLNAGVFRNWAALLAVFSLHKKYLPKIFIMVRQQ